MEASLPMGCPQPKTEHSEGPNTQCDKGLLTGGPLLSPLLPG